MEIEKDCFKTDFIELKLCIEYLQEEMLIEPGKINENIRWMREGLGVFLDDYAKNNKPLWFGPSLRFNPQNVSIERVENGIIIPTESTPGGIELWKNKSSFIVGGLASYMKE